MSVSPETVERIAELARIRVAPEHLAEVQRRLGAILDMVDQLQQVDTRDIEPMANPLDATQRLRADEVTETDQRDAFQAIAPNAEDGLYLVPKVID